MNVVIITDSAKLDGGIAQIAITVAVELARRGHQVHYIAPVGPIAEQLLNRDRLRVSCSNQFDILRDPNRRRAVIHGIKNYPFLKQLKRLIHDYPNDGNTIVHVYGWYKAVSPAVLGFLLASKLPVLVTAQEYFLACPNGAFFDFQRGEICERIPLSLGCVQCHCDSRSYSHKIWRVVRTSIQKSVYSVPKRIRHILFASRKTFSVLEPYLPKSSTFHFTRNPIEAENRGRALCEQNEGFVFVGRLSREKGLMDFLEAGRRNRVHCTVVGDGPLRREASQKYPEAHFVGWQDRSSIEDILRRSRGLVFPSTWYEGQPMVPIEASAQGVPAIISNCTTATESLPHEVRSLHFQHSNVESLSTAMQRFEDSNLVKQLGSACHTWYWDNPWTIESHTRNLEHIYREVIADSASIED